MRSIYFASTSRTYEHIYCSILQTWVTGNFIIAARSLCWLGFLLGHVHYDDACIPEAFASSRNLLLTWTDDSKKSDVENTEDDRTDEYTFPCKRSRSENVENVDGFGDQQMNGDDWQHEDEHEDEANSTDQYESSGLGDDGDDGDDDDSDDGGGNHDEDYEEEGDEEEESSEDDIDDDPLLIHAREVYALNSFRIFECEYRRSKALDINVIPVEREEFVHEVHRWGDSSRKYKVIAQWFGGIVNCSCNYFSITGFLCSHSLAILPCMNVNKIPDCYLLRWQMKNFAPDQTQSLVSLPRSADDYTKVSLGPNNCSLYPTLSADDNCTDADYILAPLLRHAKEIYIQEIYNLFREEYKLSELLSLIRVHDDLNERGIIIIYKVDTLPFSVEYTVYYEPENDTVNCTCQKFASSGILCCHALYVLYVMDAVKIPPQYIHSTHIRYGVGNDTNGKVHGPRYHKFERFTRWIVKEKRINMSSKILPKSNIDISESCLGELSSSSQEVGGSVKSQKSEILFWDDQGIKSFTYKKPVMIRKLYLHCPISSRYCP